MNIIAITSGKGGVGKTTTSINLAKAMSKLGKRVVILDGNPSTPNVGLYLGIINPKYTLNDALKGKVKVNEVIVNKGVGFDIIPFSLVTEDLKKLSLGNLRKVLLDLEEHYDVMIVDSAAGLGRETLHFLELSDDIYIVLNQDIGSVTDAFRTIKLVKMINRNVNGIIINKYKRFEKVFSEANIHRETKIPVLAKIKEHRKFKYALKNSVPFNHQYPKHSISKKYIELAKLILNE